MINRVLDSAPFTDLFWERHNTEPVTDKGTLTITAQILPDQHIVLTSDGEHGGRWDPFLGIKLKYGKSSEWYLEKDKIPMTLGEQYKFVIMSQSGIVAWESGENRVWTANPQCGEFRGAPDLKPRFAGVAIPLFSIRSTGCEGIGDFIALGEFARWAAKASQRVVQILPINDTTNTHTWRDSYPYSAISVHALHPLYIRIAEFAGNSDADFEELEKLEKVDYDSVDRLKWGLFHKIYAIQGEQCLASKEFKSFFERNEWWLRPYALFSTLRDKFGSADFSAWPSPYNIYSIDLMNGMDLGLYYFLQFHADRQMLIARQMAHEVGVALKGDIPIGVSRSSVEAWTEPSLFNMNGQAGAPPDDFSTDGQNWGFPTYNWDEMATDGYLWWRRRFEKMADYFDMYRIDHILGFFRIWEIPTPEKSGLMGHFSPSLPFSADELASWGLPMAEDRYLGVDNADPDTLFVRDHKDPSMYHPRIAAHQTGRYRTILDDYEREHFNVIYTHYFYHRHNDFWAAQARKKLPALIGATSMMCCAEDLGMIPDCVAATLAELEIVTLEIQRMPKQHGQLFGNLSQYPYLSVCTTSTHDLTTIRQWWQEDSTIRSQYFNQVLGLDGEAPSQATPEICSEIVFQHLASPSIAAILPLADYLSIDPHLRVTDPASERINIPGNALHYWQYRMHISVQELQSAHDFNTLLSTLNTTVGRL